MAFTDQTGSWSTKDSIDFDWDNSVICKKCFQLFSFQHSIWLDQDRVTFPERDITRPNAVCPHCQWNATYESKDWIPRPSKDVQLKELKENLKRAETTSEEQAKLIKFYEQELDRLKKNNDKLTNDNKILAQMLQDYMTQKEKVE